MRTRRALCLLGAGMLWGCSAYDSKAIDPAAPDGGDRREDGGQSDAMAAGSGAPRAGSGGSRAGSGGGGGSAGTRVPTGGSAGGQAGDGGVAQGCTPNPGSSDCPESCPETCNGLDDDCDGDVDDGTATELCGGEHDVSVCSAGACLIVECTDDYRDCDEDPNNGCETAPEDPLHCGRCGQACALEHATATCVSGGCIVAECEPGWGDCDADLLSCETPLNSLDHCGACGTTCGGLDHATPQCDTGACGVKTCLGNFADCNGTGGDGCETPLDTLEDCAGCDVACSKASCGGGVCTSVVCTDPLADCDRDEADCEVDLSSDVANCGGCGLPCEFSTATPHATLECTARECRAVCVAGYGDCDEDYATGCESVLDDPTHCGDCGTSCNALLAHSAQTSCDAGTCALVSCAAGWADCDGVDANGCEHNTTADGPCLPEPNCVEQTFGTHVYFFCPTARTWADARTRCRAKTRTDLVNVGSSAENAFILSHRTGDSWLGGRDDAIEGLWRWSNNGVPFWRGKQSGAAVLSQFAGWNAAQPDDYNASEDCVEILADGTWNDNSCGATRGYVCELTPDECANDSAKIDPGQCGCGVSDADADSDGFAACNDACASDPNKQSAGACGCGAEDTDGDGDGTPNCNDSCPADPTKTSPCLVYAPTNFDPKPIDWSAQPTSTLNCGTTTIDSTDPDGTGPLVATVSGWCGTAPVPVAQDQLQTGGPQVVIIPLRGLTVSSGNTLRLIGNRPVVIAVAGNATIDGTIDANASGTTPGAGGNWSCTSNNPTSQGGNGGGDTARLRGASGGGGGGFGTAGGKAGTADTNGADVSGGSAGAARGNTNLTPLIGGCAGGRAGDCSTVGASGGGAVQISVSGTLDVNGTVRANGGAGATPCGASDAGGGTGGGSGGAILLEADTLDTTGATIQVNGGNGGRSGTYDAFYGCGGSNGGAGSTNASTAGGNSVSCVAGTPGGGGGYGRIRTLTR